MDGSLGSYWIDKTDLLVVFAFETYLIAYCLGIFLARSIAGTIILLLYPLDYKISVNSMKHISLVSDAITHDTKAVLEGGLGQ